MGPSDEFFEYLRFHVCLSSASIALFGYLSFNTFSTTALLLFISAFSIVGSVYSYNFITDCAEDEKNHQPSANRFVRNRRLGAAVSVFLALAGLSLSLLLPSIHLIYACLMLMVGHGYSFLRLKRAFMLKNAITGLGFGLMYLYGTGFLYLPGLMAVLLVVIAMSIIADLRDYYGDKLVRIPTLPVVLGIGNSKLAIGLLLLAAAAIIIGLGLGSFFSLLLFIPAALLVLNFHENSYVSHLYMRSGLITLVLVQLLLSLPF